MEEKENEAESRVAVADLSDFIIKISNNATGTAVKEWKYAETPEVMTLPVGKIQYRRRKPQTRKSSWDCPYYLGTKAFEIAESKITDIGTIVCSFQSIRVSILCSDALSSQMGKTLDVTVVCNDEGTPHLHTLGETLGYFAAVPGSTTLVATFRSTIHGSIVEQVTSYPTSKQAHTIK